MEVKEHLDITLVQLDVVWESVDQNLIKIENLLSGLTQYTEVIILPEAFNTGFSTTSLALAELPDGNTVRWMQSLSIRKNCAICGSLFIREGDQFFNRFVWIEPDGKEFSYNKRHLFSLGGEDKLFSRGEEQLIIEYKGWKIFPQICYDLRFPVWSRNIHAYDLLINVANWPASRDEVWSTLLKARAIENQCYVAAVNRIGTDGNSIDYSGNSMVIDPKGIDILKTHDYESVETVSLDYSALQNFRKRFNTLKDGDHFSILK